MGTVLYIVANFRFAIFAKSNLELLLCHNAEYVDPVMPVFWVHPARRRDHAIILGGHIRPLQGSNSNWVVTYSVGTDPN